MSEMLIANRYWEWERVPSSATGKHPFSKHDDSGWDCVGEYQ